MVDPDHAVSAGAAYDATAETYAALVGTELTAAIEAPLDRAILGVFADSVAQTPGRFVADIGCGPGRVAAFLAAQDLDVVGIDVSIGMLEVARSAHPGIRFEEGRLTRLPLPDGSLDGAVCWYSIIHTPPEHLDAVFDELARVLAPGGHLLLAFQAGNGEAERRSEMYGTEVSLTTYRHSPDEVTRCVETAGLQPQARAVREAHRDHESTPQAFILARAGSSDG